MASTTSTTSTKPDLMPAAQARVSAVLADAGGDCDAALLLLALLLEAALTGSSAGYRRDPPAGH